MKKLLGVIVVLVAAVLLVGPWAAGSKAEKQLNRFVEQLDSYPGYNAALTELERGWFNTRARLTVSLDMPNAPEEAFPVMPRLPLVLELRHGPLLLDDPTLGWYSWRLGLTDEQSTWIDEHLTVPAEGDLYEAHGHMGLLGSVEHHDKLLPFTYENEQGVMLNVNGYSGEMTIDADRQLQFEGIFEGMDFSAQDALVVVGPVNMSGTGDISRMDWDTFLYPGDFYMGLSSLEAESGGETITLRNAAMDAVVEMPADADWFSLIASLSVEQFVAPELELAHANMTLAYERISTAAYEAYMNAMMNMSENPEAGFSAEYFTPEVLREFFANAPAFELRNLSFSMPQGDLDANWRLSMKEGFTLPDPIQNPMMLIQALQLKANAEIDRSLALHLAEKSARARMGAASAEQGGTPAQTQEQTDAAARQQAESILQTLAQQGMLVEDGEDLKAALEFIDGQLILNGRPMPLPLGMLLGGGAQPPVQPQPMQPQSQQQPQAQP